jgi:hypothetical protein
MKRISAEIYAQNPTRYSLVSGLNEGAPMCPFGNHYQWIGFDNEEQNYVRFTKSVFKKLIKQIQK